MFSRFIRSILGRLYTTTVVLALAFSGVAWYSYVQSRGFHIWQWKFET